MGWGHPCRASHAHQIHKVPQRRPRGRRERQRIPAEVAAGPDVEKLAVVAAVVAGVRARGELPLGALGEVFEVGFHVGDHVFELSVVAVVLRVVGLAAEVLEHPEAAGDVALDEEDEVTLLRGIAERLRP